MASGTTRCSLDRHLGRLENRGPALGILAYPPEGATCAYLGPDGKLAPRRAPFDIAVREPKNQDRRVGHAKTVPGPVDAGLLRFLLIDTLNVDDLVRDPNDDSLRHSYASMLATDLELPATTLARITGHADAGFSLKVYAKDARDESAVVTDVLARASSQESADEA